MRARLGSALQASDLRICDPARSAGLEHFGEAVAAMRQPGVVVAETTKAADRLREALGLRDWLILSPRTAHTSMRGVECEPRCVTNDPECLTPLVRAACEASSRAWRRPVRFYVVNEAVPSTT